MSVARWGVARLAVGAILVVAALAAVPAGASAEITFLKAFGPNGTSATNFVEVSSVAADVEAEVIYVLDGNGNALYKFDLEGNPVAFGGSSPNLSGNKLSGLTTNEANPGERQVAVNPVTHVVYLTSNVFQGKKALQAFNANGEPSVFSATGTNEIVVMSSLKGVAVDENGAIYASDGGFGGKGVQVYDESGALIISGVGGSELESPAGSAVDSKGAFYVLRGFNNPSKFTPSEYPVTSATTYSLSPDFVDPNKAHGLAVDRETDNVYVSEYLPKPRIAVFDSGGGSLGTFGGNAGELKGPQGLAALTSEGQARVYVADSSVGESKVKIFIEEICACAPLIESTSASEVSGDSATLRAKINPFDRDTTYWFEYGLEDCAVGPCEKVSAAGGLIPAQKKAVQVQLKLSGLAPATTYYFRAVADNGIEEEGTTLKFGPSATFTTQASGLGAALSDSRVWEMVSPPKKLGGSVFVNNSTTIEASSSGEELAYASNGSLFSRPTSNRAPEPATVLAARDSGGGWANRELTPLHTKTSTFVHGQSEFKLFTPDLDQAVMDPSENTPLSPEANERTPYLWRDGAPPSFTPLLTPANVPPGTKTNPEPSQPNRVRIAGVSPDLSVIAMMSIPPLITGAAEEAVYAWSNGTIEAVSELPVADGGAVVKGAIGTGEGSVRNAISEDGSRVFWSVVNNTSGVAGLYLRDRSTGESWRLDLKQGGSGLGGERPAFSGASADGSVVYFTDSERLSANASPEGRDLYRCEIGAVEGGGLGCASLSDLSAPLGGSGESAEVIDQLPAISEDGSRLFFVARGVLDEESNEAGDEAVAGEPNLYYWEEGQAPRFVGTLAENDRLVWGEKLSRGLAVDISAALSPNGRYFTFTSEQSLTGYENRNSADQPNTEVYLYDTEAAEGERLACISCNPSGAMAVGEKLPKGVTNFPPDPGDLWAGRWVAATLPQATQTEAGGPSLRRPRAVLDNGRVFFNSVDPLAAADSNGEWDVYQYQPVGVGSCAESTATATATRSGAGCVGLLSSGSAAGDAGFLDASSSGNDVFFLTKTKLSVLDQDEEPDVYDARVNGIAAVLHPVSECAGEACQPAAAPPNDPTPASESFNGPQTPLICPKGKKKVKKQGREVCVAKHKKHAKHKKKNKQAKKSGRAGR